MKKILSSETNVTRDDRIESAPSSKGDQIKWRTRNGVWLKADDFGYEGLAEYIASQFLSQSNILDYVSYQPCVITEEGVEYRGCASLDFLSPDERLITISRLYETNGRDVYAEFEGKSAIERLSSLIETVEGLTQLNSFGGWLGKLLEFDAFILNEDRHLHNIAVILRADETFRLMPVFDNGAALLSDTFRDYPLHAPVAKLIDKVRSKPIASHFLKQLEAVRSVIGLSLRYEGSSFQFDMDACDRYSKQESERVNQVLEIQSNKYPLIFNPPAATAPD